MSQFSALSFSDSFKLSVIFVKSELLFTSSVTKAYMQYYHFFNLCQTEGTNSSSERKMLELSRKDAREVAPMAQS